MSLSTRGIGNAISCFSFKVSGYQDGMGTVSGRSCFRGLDFGVEVKTGNLLGRRSGDIEHSLGAGGVGGERVTCFRDEARGGRLAVWYILGVGFTGDGGGDGLAGEVCFGVGVGVGVCGLADITLGASLTGVGGSG